MLRTGLAGHAAVKAVLMCLGVLKDSGQGRGSSPHCQASGTDLQHSSDALRATLVIKNMTALTEHSLFSSPILRLSSVCYRFAVLNVLNSKNTGEVCPRNRPTMSCGCC